MTLGSVIMKAYIEVEGEFLYFHEFIYDLREASDGSLSYDVVKESCYDWGESPNLNVYCFEGNIELLNLNRVCRKYQSESLEIRVYPEANREISELNIDEHRYKKNKASTFMVYQADSNIKLVHISTGIQACSERYRNIQKNREEAITYLSAKVAGSA